MTCARVFNTRFWDEDARLQDGDAARRGAHPRNSAMTFMPLYAGLASPAQAERPVRERLLNSQEYTPGEREANPPKTSHFAISRPSL